MSTTTTVSSSSSSSLALPVAAIVCIAIGGYVVVIVLILAIRSCLVSRGVCSQSCGCCGKEDEPCCECCSSLADCCACDSPSLNACLDSICPARKQMDFGDFVTCQCCADPNNQCCSSQEPCCDCGDTCGCQCNCQLPDCNEINCCCCQISSPSNNPDTDQINPNRSNRLEQPSASYPNPNAIYNTYSNYGPRSPTLNPVPTGTLGTDRNRSVIVARDAGQPRQSSSAVEGAA